MPPKSVRGKKMNFGSNRTRGPVDTQPRRRRDFKEEERSEEKSQRILEEHEDDHDKTCVLCIENIEIFAKGSCDHVICYKCCSRMRVLCKENYCSSCRLELNKVVFMKENVPFADIEFQKMPLNHTYGIVFENMDIKKRFQELVINKCSLCDEKCHRFEDLRRHVRNKHEKQFCDICVQNLKIFPYEFKLYSRSELVTHRKSGDLDDKSYKGHPQCEFCTERYFDNDELLLHLRKNHFWCHFCEKDGKQEYYENYEDLRSHFRNEHYLCEENECSHEKYTSVFRTDIDYQAHKLSKHSKKLTKMAAKQARHVSVEIDYGTRKQHKHRPNNDRWLPSGEERDQRRTTGSKDVVKMKSSSEKESFGKKAAATASGASAQNAELTDDKSPLNAEAVPFCPNHDLASKDVDAGKRAKNNVDVVAGPSKKQEPQGNKEKSNIKANGKKPERKRYDSAFPPLGDPNEGGAKFKRLTTVPQEGHKEAKVNDAKKSKSPDNQKSEVVKDKVEPQIATNAKPPPGINIVAFGEKKLPPGLSAGKPGKKSTLPPGFTGQDKMTSFENSSTDETKERNAALVGLIRSLLGEQDFARFRELSGNFRRSEITDRDYYKKINDLFRDNLDMVFSELVELLPDKDKQKQLWKLHIGMQMFPILTLKEEGSKTAERDVPFVPKSAWTEAKPSVLSENGQRSKKPNVSSSEATANSSLAVKKRRDKDLAICKECGVTLPRKEISNHMDTHVDSDFPALPSSKQPRKNPAWMQKAASVVHNSWLK